MEAKNPALLSSRDGYLLELIHGLHPCLYKLQGKRDHLSQVANYKFPEKNSDCPGLDLMLTSVELAEAGWIE